MFNMKRRSKLIKEREKRGMNRSQLARAAEMQSGVITWIEEGRYIPYESQMRKIANALGWEGSLDELFEEVKDDVACYSS